MSARLRRLLPLSELPASASPPILNASWCPVAPASVARRPVPVADAAAAGAAAASIAGGSAASVAGASAASVAGASAASLAGASAASVAGAKAARLAVARAAGFPVLPGWVLPAAESRPAIRAGAAAVRAGRPAAARRAALCCPPDPALAGELRAAVHSLGGRVIVRSSSPLEHDPRWAGAFSSVAEVGPDDVVTAVRSCWAAAFAVDPLARLDACGLPPDALELGLLIQPELQPDAGGTARVIPAAPGSGGSARATAAARPAGQPSTPFSAEQSSHVCPVSQPSLAGTTGPAGGSVGRMAGDPGPVAGTVARMAGGPGHAGGTVARMAGDPGHAYGTVAGMAGYPGPVDVIVDGVAGHPGPLLAGWADGASARIRLADPTAPGWPEPSADGPLTGLLGADLVSAVARLAAGVYWALGDTSIEWAADSGMVWLLQTAPAAPVPVLPPEPAAMPAGHPTTPADRATTLDGRDAALDGRDAALAGPPGLVYAAREMMPLLAAAVQAAGQRLGARPAAAGQAAGRLVPCRPHQRPAAGCRDAILLIDQPVPALAPLLFAARGVIARGGTAGAHLAEVARSLAVPMVTGCRAELVTGPAPAGDGWLAAIDGSTGDVALLPA